MVRVNIVNPVALADQHLIAEYLEIMMLLGYVKKHPAVKDIPENYCLGKGHIKFFKNKLVYLKNRHEEIKKEMKSRGFATNITIDLKDFDKKLCNDWIPRKKDFEIIIERIFWKITKKPSYYRYYGEKKTLDFFKDLMKFEKNHRKI